MKKIGLSLSEKDHEIITKIAKLNKVSATTICSLIIQTRLSWYQKNQFLPEFGTFTYEKKMNKPTQPNKEQNSTNSGIQDNQQDERSWEEIMNDIFTSRPEETKDPDDPFQ